MSSRHIGQIFGFVPAVSFGAILFPELNNRFPVRVTKLLGWVGLVVVLLILCFLSCLSGSDTLAQKALGTQGWL